MLTTSRADWADAGPPPARARDERLGRRPARAACWPPPESYAEVGFNYRMTDLQAAVGLVQLGRLAEIVARRRELAATLRRGGRRHLPGLRAGRGPGLGHHQLPVLLGRGRCPSYPLDREELLAHLAEAGISARRGIMAAHRQPAYAGPRRTRPLPVTERLTDSTLILPLFHQMTEAEQAARRRRARIGVAAVSGLVLVGASGLAREATAVAVLAPARRPGPGRRRRPRHGGAPCTASRRCSAASTWSPGWSTTRCSSRSARAGAAGGVADAARHGSASTPPATPPLRPPAARAARQLPRSARARSSWTAWC